MPNDNPVPQNQPLQAFPTPNVGDVLIYVIVDSKSGPFSKVSEYGSAYPNKAQYPDHKLVFISPIDEDGNRKYYYACDRLNQDAYNFEISHPYGGRKDAPRYTRTYFLKREDYTPLADGVADPVFTSAILIGQEMKRIGVQELDSLYVLVQRIYDTIPAATAFDGATDATLHTYGISVDYPYNDEAFPRVTWRIPIKHTSFSPTADLAACTVSGFTTLVLVDQEYKQNEQAAELGAWVRVYEKLPSRKNKTIDDDPNWGQVTKFNYRAAEGACPAIGATFTDDAAAEYKVVSAQQSPARGSVIDVSVVALPSAASQTGTLKHSKVTDADWGAVDKYEQWGLASRSLPTIGSTSPIGSGVVLNAVLQDNDGTYANLVVTTIPDSTGTYKSGSEIDNIFCTSFTVTQKVPSSTSMTNYSRGSVYNGMYILDARKVDEDGTYATLALKLTTVNAVRHIEYKIDMETGISFPVYSDYTIGSSAPVGSAVDASGNYSETKRLDCNFWLKTTSKTTTLTTETHNVVVAAKWPAYLKSLRISPIYNNDNKVVKYIVDYDAKKEYIGSCRAVETRTWSKSEPAPVSAVILVPEICHYDGIFLNFSLPGMLHFAFRITESTGNDHPDYRYTVYAKDFQATNYTTWPASIITECNIERYKGGYIKEVLQVYAPS